MHLNRFALTLLVVIACLAVAALGGGFGWGP
jgi:hypothetical protein